MAENVREFFETLPARADAGKLAGVEQRYQFDVDGAGSWNVAVSGGSIEVTEGQADADCTIAASEETLMKIARGEQNPTTAYMTGKLKIKGDMGAAMKLQKLF